MRSHPSGRASLAPAPVPARPNQLWVLDFVSDQLVCGRRFRILAIYDVCIRRCLAAVGCATSS
jgi:putative transposase